MKLKLADKKKLFEDVCSFVFEPEKATNWLPGQYMHYVLEHPKADDRKTERWFTISTAPFEKSIQITTRLNAQKGSSFKHALLEMEIGDQIEADGPNGKFVLEPGDVHHVLISGGIGITPFRSQLSQLAHLKRDIKATLLYANSDENFVFGDELDEITKKIPGFSVKKFVGKRLGEADFKEFLDQSNTVFYVSGPEPMVESYYDLLIKMTGSEDRVKKDFFPGY